MILVTVIVFAVAVYMAAALYTAGYATGSWDLGPGMSLLSGLFWPLTWLAVGGWIAAEFLLDSGYDKGVNG